VKLQWLCRVVHDVFIRDKQNLIVFMGWPITQWLVEMFLTIVRIRVMSIRSVHSRISRANTQETFNHPSTKSSVLVTNLKCGATSMNLQKNCSTIVFLEVPDSANVASQAIRRIHRIRQTL
jgi:hypothetical protein